ncbi:Pyrrolo-quinoline quinone OS=Pirellula staleyi (strain ATCC 27377 / DSM 6068 / ICPB 4128) GN=Psta_2150 PE=4 SV=1: PQQ_3: PQQ_2 [Gemmataceae bacterium]|nr:Pyrrolo-quinoline quinone OS=Pirellula staleyi (strain ATCC 27377 / DSM 6068 / ICPB 4128) GN=Psta_2150 PE=4 SV=1: PQQ_3: PQQ_2 [Gemmataceae bacterium]VTT97994.1 Pyrrolo-quinoline quinone OS=Pirellula staleyi (strain ATCC 27377 / DSM 6068 / ICPB 4128) GN=Psta_2150 PE=4 SV=1: PQQ_3: PQQ_2 [Gemmataceae bacterium]
MTRRALLACSALALTLPVATPADWSRFRGPNGTGTAEGEMPAINPKAPLWKAAVPGRGAGSPIVVGGKVYLQTAAADGSKRSLLCLDAATGATVWTKDADGAAAHTHAKNTLASSTPACDGKQVYAVWWDGSGVSVYGYDLTGAEKWRTSLGGYKSQHGPGFSPVVHEGLVFVNVDDDERAELVAVDARTGAKKWVKERKHVRACYSTPFLLTREGKPAELILGTTTAITSYEPATGKVNWNYDVVWPKGKMPLRVIAHPVYAGGLLVMTSGDGGGSRYMVAVDPDQKAPAKVWELSKEIPYVPCLLARGDLLFWIGDNKGSFACCADAKTGKVLFNERLLAKEPSASPVMVGDKILMIAEDGEFVVFKAAPKFDEVERAKLADKEKVFASPAVADGKLFIRGESHLYCFGKK